MKIRKQKSSNSVLNYLLTVVTYTLQFRLQIAWDNLPYQLMDIPSIVKVTCTMVWRHDIQDNDIQHNNIQHNDIQHNNTQHNDNHYNNTQYKGIQHYKKTASPSIMALSICRALLCSVSLMLSVTNKPSMLSFVM